MKPKLLLFFSTFIISSFFAERTQAQVLASDSLALVDLYNSTNGPNWYFSKSWLTSSPVSDWYGVGLNGNRVNSLRLMGNALTGTLPPSFYNLTGLSYLNLYNNQISGTISSSLGNLTKLTYLEFTSNAFTGGIPSSIGRLTQLTSLALDHNQLSGNIPPNIGNLVQLSVLSLESNSLSGSLPSAIGNLKNLTQIFLSSNAFTDSLPASLFTLSKLSTLSLTSNQLSGSISLSLGNLTSLQYAYFDNNKFTGVIPTTIGNLKNLREIVFQNNRFSGSLPSNLSGCTAMVEFHAENNSLSGTIPSSIANMPALTSLYLSNNNLTGELPFSLTTMTSINGLYFGNNHLTASQNYSASQAGKNLSIVDIGSNNFNFNGLESIAKKVPNAIYSPQSNIHIHKTGNTLMVSAGGTPKNNTYQWFRVGQTGSTTIKGDSTYQPKQSGQYYVTVTNKVATQLTLYSDTFSYTVSSFAAYSSLTVSMYPNPATDQITIHGLNDREDIKITIADMSGYVWLSAMSRQQLSVAIDVSRLKAGNYLVNMNDGKEVKTIQFVKE